MTYLREKALSGDHDRSQELNPASQSMLVEFIKQLAQLTLR